MEARIGTHSHRQRLLTRQCLIGDFFICAGEVQRTWWLGLLEMTGRVNPYTFDADPTLRRLVDCVPYGLPSSPLPPMPADFRPFDLDPSDPVLLWGGGLWDWLDPLTAIRALPHVLERVPNARLLFPGTRHPTPSVPTMSMVEQARELARSSGLLNTHIFFGDWVPRDVWPHYLQRAAVGLSLHPASYETHLAFRSRLLEYIWAGLPMVVTGGDETALVVQRYGLGRVVGVQDVTGVAAAILDLLARPRAAFAPVFSRARRTSPGNAAHSRWSNSAARRVWRRIRWLWARPWAILCPCTSCKRCAPNATRRWRPAMPRRLWSPPWAILRPCRSCKRYTPNATRRCRPAMPRRL